MKRTALCHCGQLQVICEGNPTRIIMCHCELCQRRTGSSYNLGAWFSQTNVVVKGADKVYCRIGDEGVECEFHLCPVCGTNLYWKAPEVISGQIGVAVGCFSDPEFPMPTVSFYGKSRHRWLKQPSVPSYITNTRGELEKL